MLLYIEHSSHQLINYLKLLQLSLTNYIMNNYYITSICNLELVNKQTNHAIENKDISN